jgi:CRISPR-associated protein Cas2
VTEPVRRLLVAYDITEDRRREKIAHLLESYGDRVQYSVFIVDGRPAAFVHMRRRLESLVDFGSDSVIYCDLGPLASLGAERFEVVGRARPLTPSGPLIV